MPKLTKRIVETAVSNSKQYVLWCSELKGFGVYVLPSGKRSYCVDYCNNEGIRRRITIGRHGVITTEEARKLAIATLGAVIRGEDPGAERTKMRKSMTVAELCEQYQELSEQGLILGKGNRPKKPSTVVNDRGRIRRHIVPLLGSKKVTALGRSDIARFIRDVAAGKTATVKKTGKLRGKSIVKGGNGTATRTAGLLSGILSFAVSEGLIEHNPAWGVKRPAYKVRRRRLSSGEYRRLGTSLKRAGANGELPQVIDGILLLALTGCRRGEIAKLKWSEVDLSKQLLMLEDNKEGASMRPLGSAACKLLMDIERRSMGPFVLSPERHGIAFGGLPNGWNRIAKLAGFEDVTMHTLRHSFASTAADLGYSEPTIASLLGHSAHSVTNRYIHQLDFVILAAADKVVAQVAEDMQFSRLIGT